MQKIETKSCCLKMRAKWREHGDIVEREFSVLAWQKLYYK